MESGMTANDVQVFLMFLGLLLPYGLIWFVVFRYLKKYISSTLNYSILVLCSLIGMTAYYLLAFFIGLSMGGPTGSLIGAASFSTMMICNLLIVPVLLLTLILTVLHFANKKNPKQQ